MRLSTKPIVKTVMLVFLIAGFGACAEGFKSSVSPHVRDTGILLPSSNGRPATVASVSVTRVADFEAGAGGVTLIFGIGGSQGIAASVQVFIQSGAEGTANQTIGNYNFRVDAKCEDLACNGFVAIFFVTSMEGYGPNAGTQTTKEYLLDTNNKFYENYSQSNSNFPSIEAAFLGVTGRN